MENSRVLKFRAWDGVFMKEPSHNLVIDSYSGHPMWSFAYDELMPHPEWVLMQYTGLKDKNGTPIFEGDIVQADEFFPSEVLFKNGSFYFWDLPVTDALDYEWEIIGNIYEHKELLEGGK